MRCVRMIAAVGCGVLLPVAMAGGPSYDITSFTVDGGGGTSSGTGFVLSGTAGQSDATAVTLTGDGFALTGGFWPAASSVVACVGDVTGDGVTNLADLGTLFGNWNQVVPPNTGGDLTGDGVVNLADLGVMFADWNCGLP